MHECIICRNSNLESVFSLGSICPSTFLNEDQSAPEATPLTLVQCKKCNLVQLDLDVDVDLDNFYRQYWYQSSLNASMVSSLKDIVVQIETRIKLKDNDIVIDIGCNDGLLLSLYSNANLYKVGIDPALNLRRLAEKHCNEFINDYFNGYKSKAKVISAIAMFYDVIEPHKFLDNITDALDEDGIFVVQMTDLLSMFRANAFDNICFEHICVYSLNVLNTILNEHNLEIFDLIYNEVNGGSLRVYAAFKGKRSINKAVGIALQEEMEFLDVHTWSKWKSTIDDIKYKIVNFIEKLNNEDKKVYVLGASTKGNTLLQYFGINNEHIKFAADVNPDKFGLKTVATNIPIISEKEAMGHCPNVYLVLPWHFKDNIISRNKDYLEAGGTFLFPLPIPHTVGKIPFKYKNVEIGDVFGNWTVLAESNKKGENKYWDCKCVCGNICPVRGNALIYNKSSKCNKCSHLSRLDDFHVAAGSIFQQYKRHAKKRGLTFDLTKEKLKTLIKQDCHYCGGPPSNVERNFSGRRTVNRAVIYNGIDRVDNFKGYILENCVPCCCICNWAKSDLTVEQFRNWIKKIYTNQFKKTTDITPGQLVDQLFTTDYKCWWAQEKIMDMSLSESERLKAATQAQEYNAKRTKIIRAIDKVLGFSDDTTTEKTYETDS